MNQINQDSSASKWLIIETDETRKVFVFRPEEENTIVVGGTKGVHFQVVETAPLCFYVERSEDELLIVPAYVGHLRLNSQRILKPTRLPPEGFVEFGRHRLQLTVQEVPPDGEDVTGTSPAEVGPGVAEPSLIDEDQATSIAEYALPPEENDAPTTMMEAPGASEAEVTTAMEFAPPEDSYIPPSLRSPTRPDVQARTQPFFDEEDPALATQIMGSVPDFDDEFPGYSESEPVSVRPDGPRSDGVAETRQPKQEPKVALTSAKGAPVSLAIDAGAERTEGIAFDEFVPPTGKSKAVPAPQQGPEPVENGLNSPSHASRKPHEKNGVPEVRAHAGLSRNLEQLGTWAKKKPVLALGGGVAVALFMGLVVGGVNRLLSAPDSDEQSMPRAVQTEASAPKVPEPAEPSKPEVHAEEPASQKVETAAERETVPEEIDARAAEEKAHAEGVNRAVEHLVAGRDDEAAHAYQSVAQTKYATEQLKRMSELLQKRNQSRRNKKPAAQTPGLYR